MIIKNILVTNDDGIYSPGIFALAEALQDLGDVSVVAPLVEKSAVGHAITVSVPLRVTQVERNGRFFGHAVDGTPADCVKIAVKHILEHKPDIIISGINQGSNTATNIIYSGTVSAAAEGVIQNIPAIAVSLTSFKSHDFRYSAKIARMVAKMVLEKGLPARTLLNINVPPVTEEKIEDIVIAKQGLGRYEEVFDKRTDPQNRTYFWLSGKKMILDKDNDVDDVVVMQNKVSITPIQYDLTHYEFIKELKTWNLKP